MGIISSKLRLSRRSRARPPPPFPPELYARIFEFVICPNDLLSLCLVSKAFHREAERALYRTVNLSNDHVLINTWFKKISTNPRLAALVRTISFGFIYPRIPTPRIPWLQTIHDGLNALVNLKELNLYRKSNKFITGEYAMIIANHSFRLRTFRNEMFDLQSTLSFLQSQPDLTVWRQADPTPCLLPEGVLINLTDINSDPWILPHLTSRPITRITTQIQPTDAAAERQLISMLGAYGEKVTSLDLKRDVFEGGLMMAEFIGLLAAGMPLLEHLNLRTNGELTSDSTTKEVATSLSHFPKLTTLSLFPDRALNPDSLYIDHLSIKRRPQAVSQLFTSSPSLRRLALPDVHMKDIWHARSPLHAMAGDIIIKVR